MAELRLAPSGVEGRPRVLFFVEGYTDIRFVVGLSEICDLTMAVPAHAYESSELKARVAASGARLHVHEIAGGRAAFQLRSLSYLWREIPKFDVVLSQEMLRGSLNATVLGALRGVPVVTTMALPPLEYFRCRRERGQMGVLRALAGEAAIRMLMTVNGRLASRCLALGPYLQDVAGRYCTRTEPGYYYGVDVNTFQPARADERAAIRRRLELPLNAFLIVLASRISHEKDPETVLQAVAAARARGVDAVLLNLSGGYQEFLRLAQSLGLDDSAEWVLARPAVHPMTGLADYMRAADVLVQGSLEEGFGLSPLEALSCETPVVATNVGGMAAHLGDYATLTQRRDAGAMANALVTIASNPEAARVQARRGREYVCREWSRTKAFHELRRSLVNASQRVDTSAAERVAARTLLDAIRAGFYAQKQINSRSRLIAWSHRGRFATGLRLAREVGGARTLDYGCGDGTFLGLLMNEQPAPRIAVGAELTTAIVTDCRERFKGQNGLHFVLVEDLDRPAHQGAYDAVYCMEVLEHVVDPAAMLDTFKRLLAPGGTLVISVPIETGIPVVVKQIVRRIAGWRGVGHYPGTTGYTLIELLRSVFAHSTQHITRPVITGEDGRTFYDHKGFNWRLLRGLVSADFDLVRESTSPVEWLGPQLGTQRWLIARKRSAAGGSAQTTERVA